MFNTPEGKVKDPDFLKKVSSLIKEDDHLVVVISLVHDNCSLT
uniref:Rhodanese-related sulfurtransferase n=1 Tax=Rhizophora mucronata TaxID=61149 RepID=A0A2P2J5A2_RHIMU